jgi:prepilin-type N-terminal cleavage/methylation domain-containing protein
MRTRPHLLRDESGFTLIELIVVLAIMLIVIVGVTTSFVSGTHAEIGVSQRQQAQQNALTALTRMREDIHCSNAVASVAPNSAGGFTLALTETFNVCPAVDGNGSTSNSQVTLEWCTIPDVAHPGLFLLYRNNTNCDGTSGAVEATDVSAPTSGWPQNASTTATSWAGNIWPTNRPCPTGYLPTVAVDIAVNPDPSETQLTYELKDEISLRNANACV